MQKLVIASCLLMLASLYSCGNTEKAELQQREQQYAALLEQEYNAFLTSDRYKTFKQRYELLCDLAQRVDNDSVFITSENFSSKDSLCFIPAIDWNSPPPETPFKTFEHYTNSSAQVSAAIVYEWFYEKIKYSDKFSNEFEHHEAYTALDKDAFLKKCYATDSSSEIAYMAFCNARIYMDNLNHCKYFIILKTFDTDDHIVLPHTDAGDYFSGQYRGTIYVYNIEQKQMETTLSFTVRNSATVSLASDRQVDETLYNDLSGNLQKKMRTVLDSVYGVKGDLPEFYLNSIKKL